jgi:hypothetical protein
MEAERAHAFARAVVARQAARATTTTVEDDALMREVAQELGMSDEELLQARADAEASKQRARAMLRNSAVEEAIAELESTVAFSPHDVDAMYLLAHALYTRWKKSGSDDDLQRSHRYCLSALQGAPGHADAPGLLAALKLAEKAARNKAPGTHGAAMWIGVAAAAATLIGTMLWLFVR